MGNELYNSIKSINLKLKTRYSMSMNKLLYDHIMKEGVFEIKFEDFLWAYSNVLTRKYSLNIQNNPIEILIPIIDYLNHSSINNNVEVVPHFDRTSQTSSVILMSTRNIEPGEQLLRNYGSMNNMLYYIKYGFFEEDNPIKEINIPFVGLNIKETLEEQEVKQDNNINSVIEKMNQAQADEIKRKLFEKYNINIHNYLESEISLYENKFDSNLMKFLRILFVDSNVSDKEEQKIHEHNYNKLFSVDNERQVLSFLKQHLNLFSKDLRNQNYLNLIEELGIIDSLQKYKKKNILKLENEEKNILNKNLIYIEDKLTKLI
jgi:hypothetical protein